MSGAPPKVGWGPYNRARRARRKPVGGALGTCRDCPAPIVSGSRCEACRFRHALAQRRRAAEARDRLETARRVME